MHLCKVWPIGDLRHWLSFSEACKSFLIGTCVLFITLQIHPTHSGQMSVSRRGSFIGSLLPITPGIDSGCRLASSHCSSALLFAPGCVNTHTHTGMHACTCTYKLSCFGRGSGLADPVAFGFSAEETVRPRGPVDLDWKEDTLSKQTSWEVAAGWLYWPMSGF